MAFSLGIISYTIKSFVETIEDVADRFLSVEVQPREPETISDDLAGEIFEKVSEKSVFLDDVTNGKNSGGSAYTNKYETNESLEIKTNLDSPSVYKDLTVTEYYLKYSFDIDDIANTQMRSNFAGNAASLFRKSAAQNRNRQNERAREQVRLREEAAQSDQIRRAELLKEHKKIFTVGKT